MNLLHFLSLLFVVTFIPCSAEEDLPSQTPIHASIITPKNDPVTLETLKKFAPKAKITTDSEKPGATSHKITWGETTLVMNFSEDYDQETQNKGALGWISRFPKEDRNTKGVVKLQKVLPTVKHTYGLVLPHGFDGSGVITSFLLKLSEEIDGYLFCNNSFYDYQGFRVIGLPTNPPLFGRAGRNLILLENPVPPNELIIGTWDVFTTAKEEGIEIILSSEDEFLKNGTYTSKGRFELLITPLDFDESFTSSFDFTIEGKWTEKAGQIIIDATSTKTNNPQSEIPELKEAIVGTAKEFSEDTDPDVNWILTRDRKIVFLEETENGIISMMVRKENEQPKSLPKKVR